MGLSTGKLIAEHIGAYSNGYSLGEIIGRGGTSGIGVFSFDFGGFIVDGGHSLKSKSSFLPSSASQAKPPHLNYWLIMIFLMIGKFCWLFLIPKVQ